MSWVLELVTSGRQWGQQGDGKRWNGLWGKGWSQENVSWEGVKFRMWCMRNLESFWSQILEIFSSSNENLLKLEHLNSQAAVLCSSHFLCTFLWTTICKMGNIVLPTGTVISLFSSIKLGHNVLALFLKSLPMQWADGPCEDWELMGWWSWWVGLRLGSEELSYMAPATDTSLQCALSRFLPIGRLCSWNNPQSIHSSTN